MMARGLYFSEYAVVDTQENSLSVINVIEGLESSKFPLFLPKVTVTVLTQQEEGDPDTSDGFLIFNINGNEFQRIPVQIAFRGRPRSRMLIRMGGFLIPSPGILEIVFEYGGEALLTHPIVVEQKGQPQVENR